MQHQQLLFQRSTLLSIQACGPMNAAHQIITPNQMRGQMTALYLFIFNIIGFGLVRPLSRCYDYVFGAESQIGYSLSSTAVFLARWEPLVIWLGLKHSASPRHGPGFERRGLKLQING